MTPEILNESPRIEMHLGDCLEILKTIPDKSIDLVLTDPPYGIKRFEDVEKETTGCFAERGTFSGASTWNNMKPTNEHWEEIFRISKNQIIFGGNNFGLPPTEYFIIWDKQQMMPNFAQCEYIWVSMGLKKPAKIFRYSIMKLNNQNRKHPTQKPLSLLFWILEKYSESDEVILDPFMGSGTTLVAAKELGRNAIGIEIEPKYYEIAKRHINQAITELF